jgi:hypothetical protein
VLIGFLESLQNPARGPGSKPDCPKGLLNLNQITCRSAICARSTVSWLLLAAPAAAACRSRSRCCSRCCASDLISRSALLRIVAAASVSARARFLTCRGFETRRGLDCEQGFGWWLRVYIVQDKASQEADTKQHAGRPILRGLKQHAVLCTCCDVCGKLCTASRNAGNVSLTSCSCCVASVLCCVAS